MTSIAQEYVHIEDIQRLIASLPTDSIISRTVYADPQIKVVIFGFDAGQALSEHTASQSATIQILQGEATITLAGSPIEAKVGTWIHMSPNTAHSVLAKTPLILLLTLLRDKAT
jgi:quercetin dioxygenase-like cupin family protein